MDSTFYHFQLVLLAVICTVFLAFERYLKSKKPTTANLKELLVEENLEVGHSTLPPNGATVPAITPRAGALSTLMQKYLLVYAVVMGKVVLIMFFEGVDPFQRCRLAPGPICLLSLSRAIRFPRTASCCFVCHWLYERCHLCSACGCMGRHVVSTRLILVRVASYFVPPTADASGFVCCSASYMQRRAAFSSSHSSHYFSWHASSVEYRRPYCFPHSRVGSYHQAQVPRYIVKT